MVLATQMQGLRVGARAMAPTSALTLARLAPSLGTVPSMRRGLSVMAATMNMNTHPLRAASRPGRVALQMPATALSLARAQPSAGLRIRVPKSRHPLKRGRGKQVQRARPGANFKPKSKKYNAPEKVKFKPHKGLLKRIKVLKDDNGRTIFKRWHNYTTSHMYGISHANRARMRKPAYIKTGSQNRLFRKLLGLRL